MPEIIGRRRNAITRDGIAGHVFDSDLLRQGGTGFLGIVKPREGLRREVSFHGRRLALEGVVLDI